MTSDMPQRDCKKEQPMTSGERKWCDLCGEYIYPDDEPESECCYLDCPMSPIPVRDTGDELVEVLGEALRRHGQ